MVFRRMVEKNALRILKQHSKGTIIANLLKLQLYTFQGRIYIPGLKLDSVYIFVKLNKKVSVCVRD